MSFDSTLKNHVRGVMAGEMDLKTGLFTCHMVSILEIFNGFSDIFSTISEWALYSDILCICTELLRAGGLVAAFTQWKRRKFLIKKFTQLKRRPILIKKILVKGGKVLTTQGAKKKAREKIIFNIF